MVTGQSKIIPFDSLSEVREKHAKSVIVHCHGVFDVLHAGHLSYFQSAKKNGDLLVVTLTADKFVNKGPNRPYYSETVRAAMIAALQIVDYVAVNNNPTAEPVIAILKPNFYAKGPDYKDLTKDVTGGIYREQTAVEKAGGRLIFTDDATMSSSALINRFFNPWNDAQTKMIGQVVSGGGLEKINQLLDDVAKLNVSIVGEPIIDTYVFCNPEAISSKYPCISAKYSFEENYAGGSLAIANHLADFCKSVEINFTNGGDSYFKTILEEKIDPRIKVNTLLLANIPTPRKTRFIAMDSTQRMFEITNLRHDQWMHHSAEPFNQMFLKSAQRSDVVIVADFGHGLIETPVLSLLNSLPNFISLNVQTNSSNFGFNPFTKHKKFSYLCIDTREARFVYYDRYTPPIDLAKRIFGDLNGQSAVSITLGPNGSTFFSPQSTEEVASPAFTDKVVDATGAGDAYFAITSLLVKVGAPPVFIPFMGNVFAGLKTKIVGNKTSVTRADFVKALQAILK